MGQLSPLRYRGYVYDRETGLYYLQSRYYNPNCGRFLNADSLVSTGQGVLGYNMFAYCLNNPVCRKDVGGATSVEIFDSDGNPLTEDDERFDGGKMGNSSPGGNGGGKSVPGGQGNSINYTDKVIEQMNNAADLNHSFPSIVDAYVDVNSGQPLRGGDGVVRTYIAIPGFINNASGVFEYIIEPNGICNHRFFRALR